MDTQRNRLSGRPTELNLEGLIARAHVLDGEGRQTIAALKAIRARVEATRAQAERTLMLATAALQGASERMKEIRRPAG